MVHASIINTSQNSNDDVYISFVYFAVLAIDLAKLSTLMTGHRCKCAGYMQGGFPGKQPILYMYIQSTILYYGATKP